MTKIAIADQIACAERELRMRENTFPRWVAAGRITEAHARTEILRQTAIVVSLNWLAENYDDLVAFVADRKLRREGQLPAAAEGFDDHPAVVAVRKEFPDAAIVGARDMTR